VAVLTRIQAHRVVIGHLPKLSHGVDPAAPTVLHNGPHLLVTELDVGPVTPAVVHVVDHVGGFRAPGYVYEQAAPTRPGGVGNLLAADHQRGVDFVASDLTNAVSEPGQLNPADLAREAVVIFYPNHQQPTVDSQGSQILGVFGVECPFMKWQLSLEFHPM
jgi:hypothetical protein